LYLNCCEKKYVHLLTDESRMGFSCKQSFLLNFNQLH